MKFLKVTPLPKFGLMNIFMSMYPRDLKVVNVFYNSLKPQFSLQNVFPTLTKTLEIGSAELFKIVFIFILIN